MKHFTFTFILVFILMVLIGVQYAVPYTTVGVNIKQQLDGSVPTGTLINNGIYQVQLLVDILFAAAIVSAIIQSLVYVTKKGKQR